MSEETDRNQEVTVVDSTRGRVLLIEGETAHVILEKGHKHWTMPARMLEKAEIGEGDFFILEQIKISGSGENEDTLRVIKIEDENNTEEE